MRYAIPIACALFLGACGAKKGTAEGHPSRGTPDAAAGGGAAVHASSPRALVYRTRADHRNHVPVLLSEDGSRIISYPHPKDLRLADGPPLPTPLGKGYLLDNRGISMHVAFLGITYAEYAALDEAPSLEKLQSMIIDKDPLTELCECGPKAGFKDIARELGAWVDSGELLQHCKKLK